MTDPGFLSRWSRRKAATLNPGAAAEAPPATIEAERPPAELPPAELPPIETLGPASDYTAFLRAGVSRAIQTQALGIAWASDPVIAGFRGMAEYDWDFNATGYGRLAATDNVAELLRQIITPIRPAKPEPERDPDAEPTPAPPLIDDSLRIPQPRIAALPPEPEPEPALPAEPEPSQTPRRHGSALPT